MGFLSIPLGSPQRVPDELGDDREAVRDWLVRLDAGAMLEIRLAVMTHDIERMFVTLHEFGGLDGAELVQAADSLSFLETLQDVVKGWVTSGEYDVTQARAKHQYMFDRIRIDQARHMGEPLLSAAMASLHQFELAARRAAFQQRGRRSGRIC
jgi:hypothetical protein